MKKPSRWLRWCLIVGIVLIAINLRPALAGVGSLTDAIRESTGLSSVWLGTLTTLPLVAFGIVSTLTPLLTKRFGIGWTLVGAMVFLAVGIAMRWAESLVALFVGTAVIGVAIAVGNVLLPTLTKRNFSDQSGLVTSLYSAAMGLGAALAAGVSVPLSEGYGLGWRGSLAVWAIPAIMVAGMWIPLSKRIEVDSSPGQFWDSMKRLMRSRLAWNLAGFMGLQSLTFYVILAWLPAVLTSRGAESEFAGWMLSLSQGMGIAGSLIVPIWAGRYPSQRGFVVGLSILEMASLLGLMFSSPTLAIVWVSILGLVFGGSFGLALLFIVVRSKDAESANDLSGMVQSIGYLLAAVGPPVFGGLYDFTGEWIWPFGFLLAVAVAKLAVGWPSAADRTVA